jgi:xanthine dehydrogenase YagR molybdenum-binding subunit
MAFGMPQEKIRVIAPIPAAGSAPRVTSGPHEILARKPAKILGRPVRLQLTRAQKYSMVGHQPSAARPSRLEREPRWTAHGHARTRQINTTSITDMQFEGPGTATRTYYARPPSTSRIRSSA